MGLHRPLLEVYANVERQKIFIVFILMYKGIIILKCKYISM